MACTGCGFRAIQISAAARAAARLDLRGAATALTATAHSAAVDLARLRATVTARAAALVAKR